jgi:hypothetical protein
MGAAHQAWPVSKSPRPGDAAAGGRAAPCSPPAAAALAVPIAHGREVIAASLERKHPHWRVWFTGRWHARRRGDWLALENGGRYYLSAPGRHELSVLLSLEDDREPRGAWRR